MFATQETAALHVTRVPRATLAALDVLAREQHRSRAGEVRRALEEHVRRELGREGAGAAQT